MALGTLVKERETVRGHLLQPAGSAEHARWENQPLAGALRHEEERVTIQD